MRDFFIVCAYPFFVGAWEQINGYWVFSVMFLASVLRPYRSAGKSKLKSVVLVGYPWNGIETELCLFRADY